MEGIYFKKEGNDMQPLKAYKSRMMLLAFVFLIPAIICWLFTFVVGFLSTDMIINTVIFTPVVTIVLNVIFSIVVGFIVVMFILYIVKVRKALPSRVRMIFIPLLVALIIVAFLTIVDDVILIGLEINPLDAWTVNYKVGVEDLFIMSAIVDLLISISLLVSSVLFIIAIITSARALSVYDKAFMKEKIQSDSITSSTKLDCVNVNGDKICKMSE